MKALLRILTTPRRWLSWRAKPEEAMFCTETSCAKLKKYAGTGSLNQSNPARDNCWNISNCKL